MALNIGKVAKLFDVLPETLRYYEREGFLSPTKNSENGYREYAFEDLFLLTDLLFYRDIGIPIRDIKDIFDGIGVNEITGLIDEKKQEIKEKLAHYQECLTKLENWEQLHKEALTYLDQYDLRPMPAAIRKKGLYSHYGNDLKALQKGIPMKQGLAFFATFSFYCNFKEDPSLTLHRYVALDKSISKNLTFSFTDTDVITEEAPSCLFTVIKYQSDTAAMLAPLRAYAAKNALPLTGQIYGRQSINDYGANGCTEYYRVYAVLEASFSPQ